MCRQVCTVLYQCWARNVGHHNIVKLSTRIRNLDCCQYCNSEFVPSDCFCRMDAPIVCLVMFLVLFDGRQDVLTSNLRLPIRIYCLVRVFDPLVIRRDAQTISVHRSRPFRTRPQPKVPVNNWLPTLLSKWIRPFPCKAYVKFLLSRWLCGQFHRGFSFQPT